MPYMRLPALLVLLVAFGFSSKAQYVDLSYKNLTTVPDSLDTVPMSYLILAGNPLKELPNWLADKEELTMINLDNVQTLNIKESFEILKKIKRLDHLSWGNGQLLYLPSSIVELDSLQELNIPNNCITDLPTLEKNSSLSGLDLSFNNIDTLGDFLTHFPLLKKLDFSENPGLNKEINFKKISELAHLEHLVVLGISDLNFISNYTKANFVKIGSDNITHYFESENNAIKELEVTLNTKNDPDAFWESLSHLSKLKKLKLQGQHLDTLPYHLGLLNELSMLSLSGIQIKKVSAKVKQLDLHKIHVSNSSISGASNFFKYFHPVELHIRNVQLDEEAMEDIRSGKLDQVWSFNSYEGPCPSPKVKISRSKGGFRYSRDCKHQVLFNPKSINKTYKNSNGSASIKRIIYPSVGEQLKFGELTIDIPPNAFMDRSGRIIEDDVTIALKNHLKNKNILSSGMKLRSNESHVISPFTIVEIEAFAAGKKVYLDKSKHITVSATSYNLNGKGFYSFEAGKNSFRKLKSENKYARFKSYNHRQELHCNHSEPLPEANYSVRKSKVQIKVKRNKRKQRLSFELIPEYGYREKFFQLFGEKIKGYPELKRYKKLKWKYLGDSLNADLKKLYFLSDQAKEEHLKKKSSLKFYVLTIDDIFITAHPEKDVYLINIVQNEDTLSLEALPQLNLRKPKKIQRWHKKRFKKYTADLAKRRNYWRKLDSLDIHHSKRNEDDIERYRRKLPKQGFDKRDHTISKMIPTFFGDSTLNHKISTQINDLGIIAFCDKNYLIDKRRFEDNKVQAPEYSIDNKTLFRPKEVFIFNPKLNLRYWTSPDKAMQFKGPGITYVFCEHKDSWYKGELSYTILLEKIDE